MKKTKLDFTKPIPEDFMQNRAHEFVQHIFPGLAPDSPQYNDLFICTTTGMAETFDILARQIGRFATEEMQIKSLENMDAGMRKMLNKQLELEMTEIKIQAAKARRRNL